ncbi:HpcH/HpaI aldolase/citrate lyase family protein [Salinibacterium soli]|uniref:CoA ester lyase n=1 Tax=Antiquaquibacter soli TaxID=3064523 RepID=A0ABT9BKM1_9MICO|nr:CoA ester lyase [Protaetiibacter sp. WY-16]MDO7881555.1 CoA ester lyase [Protaetiibacter sp. WY-16]
MTPRTLRSHLYLPADNERFLAKAPDSGADAVILDLEDAVAPDRKAAALAGALRYLEDAAPGPERWVRVNGGDRGLAEIEAVASAHPDGVWLPKAEPGEWIGTAVAALGAAGIRPGILIESAAGLVGLPNLPPLPGDALTQLGEVDMAADLRMRDRSEEAMVPFRARIVLETAIRRLPQPVAPVDDRLGDAAAFRAGSVLLRDRGFGSRACIHPSQVPIVNEVFGIDPDELERARRVLEQHAERSGDGLGAYRDEDGRMADLATIRWARDLVGRAEGEQG